MTCDFTCEGCGISVVHVGLDAPSAHGLCAICAWLSEHETPERIMELRREIEPGGWVRERVLRSYRDPSYELRACDHCGRGYRGPAVYCSFACAIEDADA